MTFKIFSFFSGAGFLDLGFETEGFEILFVNESEGSFLNAYKHARRKLGISKPQHGYYEKSITDFYKPDKDVYLAKLINESKTDEALVGFIGGPPCPDFSVGGKNKGKDGENGILSKTYVDLIIRHKPDFFLFENVKGLLKTAKHKVFYNHLKNRLKRAGYKLTERLINALEYGVPQNRERIILIGFRSTVVLGRGAIEFPWQSNSKYPDGAAFKFSWDTTNPFVEDSVLSRPENIAEDLTVEYWFKKNRVSEHVNSEHYFQPRQGLKRFLVIPEGQDNRKSFKRLHRWRYSPTAAYGNNEVHLHPYKARRLTVAEALAIQSLPAEFSLPDSMSLTNMFKTVGNGVPYLASKMIAKTLKIFLTEHLEAKQKIPEFSTNSKGA